jgi:glutamate formiminotransferase/formiminotetrahydrofolate cyclodeaminase
VRKGEFEGLRDRIGTDPAADPDAGPKRIHPTAGATAIGARPFLVAFNVYLDTGDVAVAKEIAKIIRTSSGGLPAVQASGFTVEGLAQVSMNLLDIDVTSPATAFATIETEALRRTVGIKKSELVGLVPERAILGAGAAALKLPDPTPHLLEAKIRAGAGPSLDGWIDELAGGAPVPGGGSASALAGALAAALVAMVARLTVGRKAYAAVEPRAQEILTAGERLRAELRRLVDDDAVAYAAVSAAYKFPKDDPIRPAAIDIALLGAADTPLAMARAAAQVIALAREIGTIGNTNARSDAQVAEFLGRAALAGAVANVRINIASLTNSAPGAAYLAEADALERAGA